MSEGDVRGECPTRGTAVRRAIIFLAVIAGLDLLPSSMCTRARVCGPSEARSAYSGR